MAVAARCRGPAAASVLGLRVRIPPRPWISLSCQCCVLSGRGLFDGSIARPGEAYRLSCVQVYSWNLNDEEALAPLGLSNYWGGGSEIIKLFLGFLRVLFRWEYSISILCEFLVNTVERLMLKAPVLKLQSSYLHPRGVWKDCFLYPFSSRTFWCV